MFCPGVVQHGKRSGLLHRMILERVKGAVTEDSTGTKTLPHRKGFKGGRFCLRTHSFLGGARRGFLENVGLPVHWARGIRRKGASQQRVLRNAQQKMVTFHEFPRRLKEDLRTVVVSIY